MNRVQNQLLKIGILLLALTGCSTESYLETGSYNSNTLVSNALTLCHQNETSKGKTTLEKVMINEKSNPFYWNALAICYSLSNERTKANYYYELGLEAVALYKSADRRQAEAALHNNIGLFHLSYKRFNDAYTSFKKAEAFAPASFNIQLNISQLYLEFKYDDRALAILNKLENLRPGDSEVLYSLALIYTHKTDYEKALVTLAKINIEKDTRPDIAGLYAYNLLRTNQLTEAQSTIDKQQKITLYEEHNNRNKIIEKEIETKLKEHALAIKK